MMSVVEYIRDHTYSMFSELYDEFTKEAWLKYRWRLGREIEANEIQEVIRVEIRERIRK